MTAIFSIAEARAFDKGQLSNVTSYPDATITAQEAAIRAKFERVIGVALSATETTEYHDGDGSSTLYLMHHNPWAASTPAAVTLSGLTFVAGDGSETELTESQLAAVVKYPHKLVLRNGTFPAGWRNIKVVYTHGYTAVPADIKTAALRACVQELVPTSVPSSVIDGTDGTINWSRVKDPERGRWYGNESIDAVLREHRAIETLPGVS